MKIEKLKYPLWLNIVFSVLTILTPILLIVVESLKASAGGRNTVFKLSFIVISLLVITWATVKKFVISKIHTKLIAKQAMLEHDYSIENGNPDKIKYLWRRNELKLTVFDAISFIIYGALLVLIMSGIITGLLRVKLLVTIILSSYILAYGLKFMYLILNSGLEDDLDEESGTSEE